MSSLLEKLTQFLHNRGETLDLHTLCEKKFNKNCREMKQILREESSYDIRELLPELPRDLKHYIMAVVLFMFYETILDKNPQHERKSNVIELFPIIATDMKYYVVIEFMYLIPLHELLECQNLEIQPEKPFSKLSYEERGHMAINHELDRIREKCGINIHNQLLVSHMPELKTGIKNISTNLDHTNVQDNRQYQMHMGVDNQSHIPAML